jgi:hypothetical protein
MINPSDVRSPGQVAPEDEDTIELELTVEQMQALSRAAAVQQSKLSPFPLANDSSQQWKLAPTPLAKDSSLMPTGKPRSRAILLLGIAVASGLLSGYAYLAITRETPVQVAQAPAQVAEQMTPDSPAPEAPGLPRPVERKPVRFANPFDAKEVFEFPPGTSKAQARDAVAELLLQRALARQQPSAEKPRRVGKTAQR